MRDCRWLHPVERLVLSDVPVLGCDLHGSCTVETRLGAVACCRGCREYLPLPVPLSVPEASATDEVEEVWADAPACGLVVGTWGPFAAAIADLQVRQLRRTCGPLPVLIADDASDAQQSLRDVAASHEDVLLWSSLERYGHLGGDLFALRKGLEWARARDLAYVCKVSQRLVWRRPHWLTLAARWLEHQGWPLLARTVDGHDDELRTECLLLNVERWSRPELLADLSPRRWGEWGTAELLVPHLLRAHLDSTWAEWDELTGDRRRPSGAYLWHSADGPESYHALAAEVGVTLPESFSCADWQRESARPV